MNQSFQYANAAGLWNIHHRDTDMTNHPRPGTSPFRPAQIGPMHRRMYGAVGSPPSLPDCTPTTTLSAITKTAVLFHRARYLNFEYS